jgi:ferredoxin-NADP reductase/Na+-translocating ferredoxin:NAD+ oxidoreductase RnfD subunit
MILTFIDNYLNKITMYRLTWYCLLILLVVAFFLSTIGLLPYHPFNLAVSALILFLVCNGANYVFAYVYKAPSNIESVYITAFILALIIAPVTTVNQIWFLVWAAILAIASKYILAINKKHLFNPAAVAVAITALSLHQYASWWVGTLPMLPFVATCGFLIVRKIKRADLVITFLLVAIGMIVGNAALTHQHIFFITKAMLIDSPLFFFAFIMLTEPTSTPPTQKKRAVYGALVGILYAPFVNIFGFYFSPELALVTGNIFSYLVSPKQKLILTLKEKVAITTNTYDFIFHSNKKMVFSPGQYMEWTLAHEKQDSRGIRRYFTIASSPTEDTIHIGVKFYDKPSSYKKSLESLKKDGVVVASQLAGDFTLPKDKNKKLVFLAGGIGVTPFRSMVKYLLDTNEKRNIVMFYAAKNFADIAYKEIFDEAQQTLGIKIHYILQDRQGMVTRQMIEEKVPDFKERMFFISGPRSMITSFEKTLKEMEIQKSAVKTDFFPGFA